MNLGKKAKLKRVYLTLYIWSDHGGIEQVVTSLACSYKRAGLDACIFAWMPVSQKDNQYETRLKQHGVRVINPRGPLGKWASNWEFKKRLIDRVLRQLSPFLSPLYLSQVLRRRCSWSLAKQSVQAFLYRKLSGFIQHDTYMKWRLNLAHLLTPASLVHQHGRSTPGAIEWASSRRVPVVYTEHSVADANSDMWESIRNCLNEANSVTAVSSPVAAGLKEVLNVASRIVIIPNPVDFSPADLTSCGTGVSPERNCGRDVRTTTHLQVLFVGRLGRAKGLPILIEAIDIFRRKQKYVDLLLVGDGPERESLLSMVKDKQLENEVRFLGRWDHDQLPALYRSMDMLVMSSTTLEGLPLTIIEAMSFGLPIVASDIPSFRALVIHHQNGLIFPSGDARALAEAMAYLASHPQERKRMGESSRRLYEAGTFSPDQISSQYICVYNDALARRNKNDSWRII